MAPKTVSEGWKIFTARITPPAEDRAAMGERRERAHEALVRAFAHSNMPLVRTELVGSAGRGTIVRPLNDVDVFAVFDDATVWRAYRSDSKKLLYRVRDALNEKYNVKVGARGRSVRLFFKELPNVEIVPAFAVNTGGYVIPGATARWPWDTTWQKTDPYVHESFFAKRDQELSLRLKPLVRVLKCWNITHGKPLSSFHLELVAQAVFSDLGTSQRLDVHQFFEWAPEQIHVQDPAGYSGDLARNITWLGLQDLKNSLKSGYEQSGRALEAERKRNHKSALGLWRAVLGSEFPAFR
jgi:hypothetical protein